MNSSSTNASRIELIDEIDENRFRRLRKQPSASNSIWLKVNGSKTITLEELNLSKITSNRNRFQHQRVAKSLASSPQARNLSPIPVAAVAAPTKIKSFASVISSIIDNKLCMQQATQADGIQSAAVVTPKTLANAVTTTGIKGLLPSLKMDYLSYLMNEPQSQNIIESERGSQTERVLNDQNRLNQFRKQKGTAQLASNCSLPRLGNNNNVSVSTSSVNCSLFGKERADDSESNTGSYEKGNMSAVRYSKGITSPGRSHSEFPLKSYLSDLRKNYSISLVNHNNLEDGGIAGNSSHNNNCVSVVSKSKRNLDKHEIDFYLNANNQQTPHENPHLHQHSHFHGGGGADRSQEAINGTLNMSNFKKDILLKQKGGLGQMKNQSQSLASFAGSPILSYVSKKNIISQLEIEPTSRAHVATQQQISNGKIQSRSSYEQESPFRRTAARIATNDSNGHIRVSSIENIQNSTSGSFKKLEYEKKEVVKTKKMVRLMTPKSYFDLKSQPSIMKLSVKPLSEQALANAAVLKELDEIILEVFMELTSLKTMLQYTEKQIVTTIDRIPGLLEGARCLVIKEDRRLNLDLNYAKNALASCLSQNRVFELAPTGDGVIKTTMNLTHSSHDKPLEEYPNSLLTEVVQKILYFRRCVHSCVSQKREDRQAQQLEDMKHTVESITKRSQMQIKSIQLNPSHCSTQQRLNEFKEIESNLTHMLDRKHRMRNLPMIAEVEKVENSFGQLNKLQETTRIQSKQLNQLNDILRELQFS